MAMTAIKKPPRNKVAAMQTPAEQTPAVAEATVTSFDDEMHEQLKYS